MLLLVSSTIQQGPRQQKMLLLEQEERGHATQASANDDGRRIFRHFTVYAGTTAQTTDALSCETRGSDSATVAHETCALNSFMFTFYFEILHRTSSPSLLLLLSPSASVLPLCL